MAWNKTEIREAIEQLRDEIKPGDTVYTKVESVSRSGMSRTISAYIMRENQPRNISRLVAKATGSGFNDRLCGVKIGGCGMDMGFALVTNLSYALHHEYDCLGDKCPAAVHVNRGPDRDKRGEGIRHKDGYALHQRWM